MALYEVSQEYLNGYHGQHCSSSSAGYDRDSLVMPRPFAAEHAPRHIKMTFLQDINSTQATF